MLPSQLKKVILDLQTAIDAHEKISLAFFAEKLRKVGSSYPEDQTINQISLVVNKMNDGNRFVISRAEIKDLYNKFYTSNTRFKKVFAEELGVEKENTQLVSNTEQKFEEFDIYQHSDKELLANLNSMFDPLSKPFSKELAKEAEKVVSMHCSFSNLEPEVESVSGDENVIVVSAVYKTPKGSASLYVPVEISNKKALIPSFFNGKDGQHYISKKSISEYVSNFFNKSGSYGNDSVGEEYSELKEQAINENEIETFANKLSSTKEIAALQHGELVERGRRLISEKMNTFGKRSHQIKVLDADKNGITYGVKCDSFAFKVPVKVESNRLQEPSIILCKGSIEAFTLDGINNFEKSEITDNKLAANVSPLFNLKASELVDAVREATEEGNYIKAEDALNVLANMNDDKAYQVAFSEFKNSLSGEVKKEANTKKCSRIIKSANSTHLVCGHLNLPLHKVYVDKHGDCRPLSRKGMENSNEGAYFMNSKILF